MTFSLVLSSFEVKIWSEKDRSIYIIFDIDLLRFTNNREVNSFELRDHNDVYISMSIYRCNFNKYLPHLLALAHLLSDFDFDARSVNNNQQRNKEKFIYSMSVFLCVGMSVRLQVVPLCVSVCVCVTMCARLALFIFAAALAFNFLILDDKLSSCTHTHIQTHSLTQEYAKYILNLGTWPQSIVYVCVRVCVARRCRRIAASICANNKHLPCCQFQYSRNAIR